MRFSTVFTYLSLATAAFAMPHVARTKEQNALSQATDIARTLNEEVTGLINEVRGLGLLKLKAHKWDINEGLHRSLTKAIDGIEGLPDLPKQDNIPQEVVDSYGPLVDQVGESFFGTLIDLKFLSYRIVKNDEYAHSVEQFDQDTYQFVRALNSKFQGFTCELHNKVGSGNIIGQLLREVSDHLFHIIFDAIEGGNCKAA